MHIAKYFIKVKQKLAQYQCSFCFEANFDLLQCGGPCHKRLCKTCFRKLQKGCPFCMEDEKDFHANYVQFLPLQFKCPSQNCQAILNSQSEFDFHCCQCSQINVQIRQDFIYKASHKCSKGHHLQFLLKKSPCCICNQPYLYTSECKTCNLRYCTSCRPPIRCKMEFTRQHDFKYETEDCYMACDLCSISFRRLINKKVYRNEDLQIDICAACYEKLPEENPFINQIQQQEENGQQINAQFTFKLKSLKLENHRKTHHESDQDVKDVKQTSKDKQVSKQIQIDRII